MCASTRQQICSPNHNQTKVHSQLVCTHDALVSQTAFLLSIVTSKNKLLSYLASVSSPPRPENESNERVGIFHFLIENHMSGKPLKGKVVFVGDTGVGKTSIIYTQNNMSREGIQATVASSSTPIRINCRGKETTLNVWDTAGQEDYRLLVPLYAHFSQVAVIVYDVTRKETFDNVEGWLKYLDEAAPVPHIFLVGNKTDLTIGPDMDPVPDDEVERLVEEKGLRHYRTSAVTGQNIDFLFHGIAEVVLDSEVEEAAVNVVHVTDTRQAGEDQSNRQKKCNC